MGLWVSHNLKIHKEIVGEYGIASKPFMCFNCSVTPLYIYLHDIISGCFTIIASF